MQRMTIDNTESEVKAFIRSLPLQSGGVELQLEGRVVCSVLPPGQPLSESEKTALFQRGRELVRRSRQRNADVPEHVIEQEVALAIEEVRQRSAS
jgi:hypothetical protein